ncbi:heterotrimeric G-protein alpha subunit, GPA3-like protein [Syncephalastrum racemosum]|uniref:Heterotrimeric G-protein alpha subunit, GPA3-like protein n=1 Tax=Syncephalastrum racemosum TaxID=13706 RepID=A0A1X2HRE5_SYNRA|nr:heterotrimeric G-protein alpha subunit, GPA3-like protein [Syncephalastrum racemosum]
MGLCLSSEERAERAQSQRIDRAIEEDSKKLKRECKLLLLGSGESGKSTIVKQMKIIHQSGYTRDELYSWRATVYRNLVESAQILVLAVQRFDYHYDNSANEYHARRIIEYDLGGPDSAERMLDSNLVEAVENIWKDGVIPRLLDQEASEFYLMDSAPYFFENVRRIGRPDYIPNEQDVLRARSKTTGITETRFKMGQMNIHMFDVGGQRSERKKWIHCFEAVTSIIFCVALSEYDQVLLEESRQNRMMESLVLFESITNSRWFLRTSIILFLNKIDLFRAKLPKVPLEKYFPDYGGGQDPSKAAKYILWRFTQTNRAKLNIYPHLTQATDTSNIRLVFAAIKETILQNALKDSGIL